MARRRPGLNPNLQLNITNPFAVNAPKQIEMRPVKSSNLAEVGYDASTETLKVKFKSGLTYTYSGVPYTVYYAFSKAASLGSYFYYNIRTSYPYKREGTLLGRPSGFKKTRVTKPKTAKTKTK